MHDETKSDSRGWLLPGLTIAVLLVLVGASFLFNPSASQPEASQVITVSRSNCGRGWTNPHPGAQTFHLRNSATDSAEAELIDPHRMTVYGEVEGLGPGTTRDLQVTLGNGDYAFQCLVESTHPIVGPTVTITGGDIRSGPAAAAVSANDLSGALDTYKVYVQHGLDALSPAVDALRSAAASGDRTATEAAWFTAHDGYEKLGAAYDAFGDSDAAINGTDRGTGDGPAASDFTGFHRIEYDLWRGKPLPVIAGECAQLTADVAKLRTDFPELQIDPNDLGLRAHEILENSLEFELTAKNDYGSGSTLRTTLSNVDGTVTVVNALRPVLTARYPGLSEVDTWLARTRAALESTRRPDGSLPPVGALTQSQRTNVDATISGLLERLAPIAAICTVRRTG